MTVAFSPVENMNEAQSPRDCVETWLYANQAVFGDPIKFERYETPSETLVVWYEKSEYLIDICTWDHACCLDITALNKNTKKTDFVAWGPCENNAALIERLQSFVDWFESLKRT